MVIKYSCLIIYVNLLNILILFLFNVQSKYLNNNYYENENGKAYIDDAMVTVVDIKADNGVVHVIDAVMTPPAETAHSSGPSSAKSSQGCDN